MHSDEPFTIPLTVMRPGDFYRRTPDQSEVTQILSVEHTKGSGRRRGSGSATRFYRIAVHGGNADGTPKTTAFVRSGPMNVYPVSASIAGDAIRAAVQAKAPTNPKKKAADAATSK